MGTSRKPIVRELSGAQRSAGGSETATEGTFGMFSSPMTGEEFACQDQRLGLPSSIPIPILDWRRGSSPGPLD